MTTKHQDIQRKVIEYIRKHELIQEKDHIILGLSGGADSVCLFMMLLAYREIMDFTMEAVHIHHGIRSEADEDVHFVEVLCNKYHVPCHVFYEDVPMYAREYGLSEEEAGREVRYRIFHQCLDASGKNGVIATAHHMNDQAETILFKLFRGSGLSGLCGIRPKSGKLIRPLLCLTREEVETFLEANELGYCTDQTNDSLDYARNRIRHKMLPYATEEICKGSIEHLGKTAEIMQELEVFVQKQTEAAYESCLLTEENTLCLSVDMLRKQDAFLQKQIIMQAIYHQTGSRKDISSVHIEEIVKLVCKDGNGSLDLPYNLQVKKEFARLSFFGKKDREEPEKYIEGKNTTLASEVVSLEDEDACRRAFGTTDICKILDTIPQKTYTKWFDYDKINEIPKLRSRMEGDYLTIDEKMSRKKLKDYLIQEKIPKELRDCIPIVADGAHVMWVVGKRISTYYKVTAQTKRILILSYHRNGESDRNEEQKNK